MTVIAAMTIEATTDTIVQSRGFDEASFVVLVPAGSWRINLNDTAFVDGFTRQVVVEQNNSIQNAYGIGTNSMAPGQPEGEITLLILNRVTNAVEPLIGSQAQVYVTVTRMFADGAP